VRRSTLIPFYGKRPIAPCVSELQAELLRAAHDRGLSHREAKSAAPVTLRACRNHRWLAERTRGFVLTDGGRAALAHFDASVLMEKLWQGRRG
jgi:hypothetical protein